MKTTDWLLTTPENVNVALTEASVEEVRPEDDSIIIFLDDERRIRVTPVGLTFRYEITDQ